MSQSLSIAVQHADGSVTRWGPDELEAEDVATSISFGTTIPGGFKDCTLVLPRKIDSDYPDLNLLDTVRIYGPGNETVWEGRVAQLPRTHGDQEIVTVGCVGWSAHLKDDPSFVEVYADRDFGSWTQPPINRRAITDGVNPAGDYTVSTEGAINFNGGSDKSIPIESIAEIMYLSPPGVEIATFAYKGQEQNTTSVEAAAFFTDAAEALFPASSVSLTLDNTLRGAAVSTPERYGMLQVRATATHTPAAGSPFARSFSQVGVYGNHGLTSQSNGTELDGFYASDVIEDIVTRAAPLLSTNIEATSFVIPHLTFKDPVSAEDAILTVNGYHLYEWGVYEDRTFFYRQADADRLTWEARKSDGAFIDGEGDTSEVVYNGVLVFYSLPDGTKRIAGPTGYEGADLTDDTLLDDSPTNPVNAAGIPRKWAILNISQVTTDAGAVQLGAIYLAERSLPARKGTIKLTGTVQHPTLGDRPTWAVRAGDWIVVSDKAGDEARRIIETSYDHEARTVTVSVGVGSEKLEAIMERFGVFLVGN